VLHRIRSRQFVGRRHGARPALPGQLDRIDRQSNAVGERGHAAVMIKFSHEGPQTGDVAGIYLAQLAGDPPRLRPQCLRISGDRQQSSSEDCRCRAIAGTNAVGSCYSGDRCRDLAPRVLDMEE